jgi:predicted AlkP superfamily phosphohydrolase/phosphomutase
MAQTPKKVAVIGLDCAMPHLIEKHIAEGHLPTFKKLMEAGTIADNCLTPFPTVTPPNWATIATGAWSGTHGITDFHVHVPGTSLENQNCPQALNSKLCQAEYIWDALDKVGKKSIVLNYVGAWPSEMKGGIVVGGTGLSVAEIRDGYPYLQGVVNLCRDQLITTGFYPKAIHGEFQEAEGWLNVPDGHGDALEMRCALKFPDASEEVEDTVWYVLVRRTRDHRYDRVTLSPAKDFTQAFFTLSVGQWSPTVLTRIRLKDGSEREVAFNSKLLELSEDAEEFRLLISALIATSGWSHPPEVAKEIGFQEGFPHPSAGYKGYYLGWYDIDMYMEMGEQYDLWLGNAAANLLSKHEWDLFFMHCHSPDHLYHAIMTDMDPKTCPDEARRNKAWEVHLRTYQSNDRMLARILDVLDKNTLVLLVSDHGGTPDGPVFDPYKVLVPAGLTTLTKEQEEVEVLGGKGDVAFLKALSQKSDMKKSKAIPQREIYVYVNLKGRDPEGIVEPEDYAKVQQEIIDLFLTYVDPETGQRPVALALSKQDARILGLYGDYVGDVIYALYPWFGSQHGQNLPASEWGIGSLKGLLTMTGPGIKKGYRLKRNVWLTDIVPTICYLMDWPVPEHTEGAVVYQFFKDQNFKVKETSKLKTALERMEKALSREGREPWDHHDCA